MEWQCFAVNLVRHQLVSGEMECKKMKILFHFKTLLLLFSNANAEGRFKNNNKMTLYSPFPIFTEEQIFLTSCQVL